MRLKSFSTYGFKSFADKTELTFDKGITAVVGPNGSGKSNISDAVKWVLGEQSAKQLRGSRMEDVIFAGTARRKPLGYAEVTLVLDNSDKEIKVDYDEIAIRRRLFRSGESEYAINDGKCRLKDIQELLMDTGIGVEGYSIIGQGKIADIIDNKMDSRREIFEEAAGITKYRTKKLEAERKLERANDNLTRVNDIVYEIEGRIGNLEKESAKATEYLEIKDKYKDVEINIILNTWEVAVIEEEQKSSEFRCWYRNPSRGSGALAIVYDYKGLKKLFYPDFLIVRKESYGVYILDILEPHDPTRDDNVGKAKALARYADENPSIGRAQLIRMSDGVAGKTLRRLDFAASSELREKVKLITLNEELDKLFIR